MAAARAPTAAGRRQSLSAGAALLRSLRAVERIDLGFRPDRVLTMNVVLPSGTPMSRRMAFQEDLLARLSACAAGRSAGAAEIQQLVIARELLR